MILNKQVLVAIIDDGWKPIKYRQLRFKRFVSMQLANEFGEDHFFHKSVKLEETGTLPEMNGSIFGMFINGNDFELFEQDCKLYNLEFIEPERSFDIHSCINEIMTVFDGYNYLINVKKVRYHVKKAIDKMLFSKKS